MSTSPNAPSLIAAGTTVNGLVSGDSELQVDGVIRGDIAVTRLFIGEGGQIEGAVQAESVEARGRLVGSITAKQVRLFANCYVEGDITHELLTIESGSAFQGRSLRLQRSVVALDGPARGEAGRVNLAE